MSAIERYLELGKRRLYKKGEAIIPLGSAINHFIYLKKGRAGRLITTSSGVQKYIKLVDDHCLIGEVTFFKQMTSEYCFEAIIPCECYFFDRKTVETIFLKDEAIVHALINWFCNRMFSLNNQIMDSMRGDAYHRICKFIEDYMRTFGYTDELGNWHYEGKLSHYDIAKYIGVNRVSVTRAIGRLEEKGVLHKDRSKLIIYDMSYLENL